MGYKYQLHAHSFPCSACSQVSIGELVCAVAEGGYQGLVITNHFKHGNTGISRDLPWPEFVRQYELDYLAGKEIAEQCGIDLLFGIEENIGGSLEVLCYGITPELLYSHPELNAMDIELWYRVVSENGGLVIQAHPFRDRAYIPCPGLLPLEFIDGIEVYNTANEPAHNDLAAEFAAEHPELILISGRDFHGWGSPCIAGIECETRIRTESDLADLLKSGKYKLLYSDK